MISTIAIWMYLFLLAFLYGTALIRLASNREMLWASCERPTAITVVMGLAVLAAAGGALSLVMNLGRTANLILLLVATGIGVWQRTYLKQYWQEKIRAIRRLHMLTLLAFLAVSLVILLKSTQTPQNYDTGLYHAQAIRWMETYPAVPGLGNLGDRLVFNSNALLLSALFSFSFLGGQSFHILNAFLAVILCGFALGKFDRLLKGEVSLANAAAVFLPFLLRRIFSLELSSPGTDLPAALIIWIVLTLSIEKIDEKTGDRFDFLFLAVAVLSIFAVTIKLSTLPILLLPFYFFLRQSAGARKISFVVTAVLASMIFLPWMSRSLVQSGYLVFPVAETGITNPDWRIPEENVRGTAGWIRSWAKIATPEREAVEQMSASDWAPVWFNNQEPLDRQILFLNGASLILMIFLFAYRAWKEGLKSAFLTPYSVIYLTTLFGILYWFFQAPAMRFGYAFLAFFPAICLAPLLVWVLKQSTAARRWGVPLILVMLLLYQGVSVYRLANPETLRPVVLYPADYPRVPTETHTLGSVSIYTAQENDQCWYEPFPCVPGIDSNLRLRGGSLADGFRMAP